MADSRIQDLPAIDSLAEGDLFPVAREGDSYNARKVTAGQMTDYIEGVAQPYLTGAQEAAASADAASKTAVEAVGQIGTAVEDTLANREAAEAAQEAAEAAQGKAEDAQEAIENLSVSAETLPPGREATVGKTVSPEGVVSLEFGIPQGKTGNVMYATFDIDTDTGELVMYTPDGYTGPVFSLANGFLEVTISA